MVIISCNNSTNTKNDRAKYKTIGAIERIDPALDSILPIDAKVEVIAEGMDWSEGPLWVDSEKMLLFSDVPQNIIYKWTEEKGKEIYLEPLRLYRFQ